MCGTCRDQLLTTGELDCPVCHKTSVLRNACLNKQLQHEVNSLKVHCEHHDKGCEWMGAVRDLQKHLDPEKGKCSYVFRVMEHTQQTTCEYIILEHTCKTVCMHMFTRADLSYAGCRKDTSFVQILAFLSYHVLHMCPFSLQAHLKITGLWLLAALKFEHSLIVNGL